MHNIAVLLVIAVVAYITYSMCLAQAKRWRPSYARKEAFRPVAEILAQPMPGDDVSAVLDEERARARYLDAVKYAPYPLARFRAYRLLQLKLLEQRWEAIRPPPPAPFERKQAPNRCALQEDGSTLFYTLRPDGTVCDAFFQDLPQYQNSGYQYGGGGGYDDPYAASGGMAFNTNGTPMIPGSFIDVHGDSYGNPHDY